MSYTCLKILSYDLWYLWLYIKSLVHNFLIPYKYNFTFDKTYFYSKSLSTKEIIWEYENERGHISPGLKV